MALHAGRLQEPGWVLQTSRIEPLPRLATIDDDGLDGAFHDP
jgi:hypothetical protein